jgi:hypothetical protein
MSSIEDIWASMQSDPVIVKKSTGKKKTLSGTRKEKVMSSLTTSTITTSVETLTSEQIIRVVKSNSVSLESENASIRKDALKNIIDVLFENNNGVLTDTDYSLIFRDSCKPIFKRMSDTSEKCRELSLRLTTLLFMRSMDIVSILGYYFPCLLQRMPTGVGYDEELKVFVSDMDAHNAYKRGRAVDRQDKGGANGVLTHVVVETSEEIRYMLCQTLEALLTRLMEIDAASSLQPYFSDVILYLQTQLRDPYPELKMLACQLLETLCRINDFEIGMKYYAVGLVRGILPVLRHRHAKVRVVAVRSLTACMSVPDRDKRKGAGTEAMTDLVGFREDNVLQVSAFYKSDVTINYLAELASDTSVQVKESVVAMLSCFMTDIWDRFDHQQRLLPYVLDLLSDGSDSVSHGALRCLEICGVQYEDDHRDDMLERRQYGVDGDLSINLSKPLPQPFTTRPSLGMRMYVRSTTKRFLTALLNELTTWISKTRLKSAALFKASIRRSTMHIS